MIECGEVDEVKVLELETGRRRPAASSSCALIFAQIGHHLNLALGSASPDHDDSSVSLAQSALERLYSGACLGYGSKWAYVQMQ